MDAEKLMLTDLASIVKQVPTNYIRPDSDRPNLSDVQTSDASIPLIDLQELHGPNRSDVIHQIGRSCREDGFFQVKNHGVPEEMVNNMLCLAGEFFHLPESERLKNYSDDPSKANRLSTSFNVKTEKFANWRDFLRLHCYPLEDYVQEWPTNPPCFRKDVAEYCTCVRRLVLALIEAISESLGLKRDYIDKTLGKHCQHMALNYYPPCPQPELTYGLPFLSARAATKLLLTDFASTVNHVSSNYIRPISDRPNPADVQTSDASIPVVDLQGLYGPNHSVIVHQIGQAFQEYGFLQNLGVPEAMINNMLSLAGGFFQLLESEKLKNFSCNKGVGYTGIPLSIGTINMISNGMHVGSQSAQGHKTCVCQVTTLNKNRSLKCPFEEAGWENAPITFSSSDYKRWGGEPDVIMPHVDLFVAAVHIGDHILNKVFIDTGSSVDILYWECFQKMQLNPASLKKYKGAIYGFNNQPVLVEGVITLPIYVGAKQRFRMALINFLVVRIESTFDAIIGRGTLCELNAIVSQPHLCMKFPTPTGIGILRGNQKMARACFQDIFNKVELATAPQVFISRPSLPSGWENAPITFSSSDYKRWGGESDVIMPHVDLFVAAVHIGNHILNKVFIDTGSSVDILYWECFQKMQLNSASLKKYEGAIYGFNNQLVLVEGVITLPIYVGAKRRFRMASINFLVVRIESAFDAIIGRSTLCELNAIVSQPHLCMKFPTSTGIGILRGNQKMARACFQDIFNKVKLATAPQVFISPPSLPSGPSLQTMSISDIDQRLEGVEQKAELIESVETIPLDPAEPGRIVRIETRLAAKETA